MQTLLDGDEVTEVVLDATRALVGVAARSLASISDDVTLAQLRVLVLIDERGPQTMGQIATNLAVSPSTVTRVCDRLVEKKLARRQPSEHDRRALHLTLTPKSRRLIKETMQRRRQEINGVLGLMSPPAQQRLAVALADFSAAAGELGDQAWTLGWTSSVETHPAS
jgi:DNA-binding MarR family transcriptional regulator